MKKTRQKNKKSGSVTIQIPDKTRNVKVEVLKGEEPRRGNDPSTPQRLASVAGHPKNRLCINIGASIHILFQQGTTWWYCESQQVYQDSGWR